MVSRAERREQEIGVKRKESLLFLFKLSPLTQRKNNSNKARGQERAPHPNNSLCSLKTLSALFLPPKPFTGTKIRDALFLICFLLAFPEISLK